MCGIAGIISAEARDGLGPVGAAMLARLEHRGPDDHGWLNYCRGGVCVGQGTPDHGRSEVMLLHRRLSILDLSPAGRQPMSSADCRYHIVFNGEIYNYVELREELIAAGFIFHTGTDTEVLLAALAHWGLEALPRLVGMFAFALLDTQARSVLLARDHFGIKPLFYTLTPKGLAFASEIKALLELPGISRRVNAEALHAYLRIGLTDHSGGTLLAGISQLPPAHWLIFRLDGPVVGEPRPYWSIRLTDVADVSFDEAARRLREMFLESIQFHLRSDVPVGTALSGGIDSSSIAAAIRAVGGAKADFHSFSFIAGDPALNEERWIDIAASAAGATVHKVRITADELAADIDELIAAQDEPFYSTSIYAQFRVFRLARQAGVKVLLDGQGGDELLAGYRGYLLARFASLLAEGRYGQAWRFLRRASGQSGIPWYAFLRPVCPRSVARGMESMARALLGKRLMPDGVNKAWFERQGVGDKAPGRAAAWPSLRAALLDSLTRASLPMLLRFEDRNSMAHGIESRVPFLTARIAEFVTSLPEEYLIGSDGIRKNVFRQAMRGIVPDAILDRRDKIGFETPERSWLHALQPWVARVLRSDAAQAIPALRHDVIRDQWEAVAAGRRKFDGCIWRWLNLISWSQKLAVEF